MVHFCGTEGGYMEYPPAAKDTV